MRDDYRLKLDDTSPRETLGKDVAAVFVYAKRPPRRNVPVGLSSAVAGPPQKPTTATSPQPRIPALTLECPLQPSPPMNHQTPTRPTPPSPSSGRINGSA